MLKPSPVTFETRAGRELALMGVVQVGVVWPDDGARGVFWWSLTLPDVPPRARRTSSIDDAKLRLVAAAGEWLDAAGLTPAPAGNPDQEARHER